MKCEEPRKNYDETCLKCGRAKKSLDGYFCYEHMILLKEKYRQSKLF